MKMLVLTYSGDDPERVSAMLDTLGVPGHTRLDHGHGHGLTGPRDGTRAFPGQVTVVFLGGRRCDGPEHRRRVPDGAAAGRRTAAPGGTSRGFVFLTEERQPMCNEMLIRRIAGVFVMVSVALGVWVSPWFLAFTAFVGFNLFQSSLTRFCPLEMILGWLGLWGCEPKAKRA